MTTGDPAVDLQTARMAFLSGDHAALEGLPEGEWIDAKEGLYHLDPDSSKFELAKDVSGFANAGGGILLIPATTRSDPEGEVIDAIGDVPLPLIDTQRIRDIVDEWVHPEVAGLDIRVHLTEPARARLMIYVPPQDPAVWPHVVTRGRFDGRVDARGVAVCVRRGPDTRALRAAEVQGLLAAGRRAQAEARVAEEADAPRFEPKTETASGAFNLGMPNGPLNANLVNDGGSAALVDRAVLETPLGAFDGLLRVQDGRSTSAIPQLTARVPRGGHLLAQFGDRELATLPQAGGELQLVVTYRRPDRPAVSQYRLQLLRSGGGGSERPRWRAGEESVVQLGPGG